MPIVVKAVPKAEFEQWLAAEQTAEGVNKAAAAQADTARGTPLRRRLRRADRTLR